MTLSYLVENDNGATEYEIDPGSWVVRSIKYSSFAATRDALTWDTFILYLAADRGYSYEAMSFWAVSL